ncbi:MAG: hypothetical protein ACE5KM_11070 [Planctomycetaceae bacterium]
MSTYEELAGSRRDWIDGVLVEWCRRADRAELLKAEADWANIAGQVDPDTTLWTWAWSRFPALVHPGMSGLDETREVRVRLNDGSEFTGYVNARRSRRGELVLSGTSGESRGEDVGPWFLEQFAEVTLTADEMEKKASRKDVP